MSRILVGLASLNTIVLLMAFTVGFLSEGRVNVSPGVPLSEAQQMFTVHLIAGLSSALLTLLLHSLIFTYFMGTGRWVQEVVKAYRLNESLFEKSRRVKSRAFPYILGSVLLVIATAILGAATDRGLLDRNIHLALASLAVGFNVWSYFAEYGAVVANSELINQIMSEVTRMRHERGLE
jgi:hypothetical protein